MSAPEHPEQESETEREERHRRAERSHWTFEKIFGSLALLFAAVAGAAGIAGAIAAFRAYNAANQGITNAIEANKISRNALIASQRAFVTVTVTPEKKEVFVQPPDGSPAKGLPGWWFVPVFENSGTTPTRDLRYLPLVIVCNVDQSVIKRVGIAASFSIAPKQNIMFGAEPDQCPINAYMPFAPYDPDDAFDSLQTGNAPVGPHAKIPISGIGITEQLLRETALPDNTKRWFVYGSIHYKDRAPDERSHITKYCYIIGQDQRSDGGIDPRMTFCSHWNCADEECQDDKKQFETELSAATRQHRLSFPTKPSTAPVTKPEN
jgi:hypothetical protein